VRLENGEYEAIASSVLADGTLSLHSEVLGLDLHLYPNLNFRFFDPISNQMLRSYAESEHDRYQAELERSQAELEKLYEQQARREAEAIAEQERKEKLQERNEKEKLAAYLRSLGINPDDI
jgi:hypothetical protein